MGTAQRIVLVSNRLPPTEDLSGDSDLATRQVSGLVSAIRPVLGQRESLWFGWSGGTTAAGDGGDVSVSDFGPRRMVALDLPRREASLYYNVFSNRTLSWATYDRPAPMSPLIPLPERPAASDPACTLDIVRAEKTYRCETLLSGQDAKGGRFHYYVCQSLIKRGKDACETPRLNARHFEQLIVGRIRFSILAKDGNGDMTTVVIKELDRLVQEQRRRIETIESELKDVRRRLDRLWDFVESSDDDLADTATPRIRANRDQQVRLEASLQEANAILSQRRATRDGVATITAKTLDMAEYPEESELPERKDFVETFVRDIVVMLGKATIHYKVPIAKDSPNPEGDSEELNLAGPPKSAASGVR